MPLDLNTCRRAAAVALTSAGILLWQVSPVDHALETSLTGPSDEELLASLNECTTGLATELATPDGRPLLWKNRDVSIADQEFHYVDDGRIPFISITYSGRTEDYYGGINAAGFAVENSNSYNFPNGPGQNGWGYGDDDGKIHMLALATCRTVDDFQNILDSTNVNGRTLNCNYGAIDAYGGAAMFETAGYSYTRCDAVDSPEGFLVRSNYSYSGNNPNNPGGSWGAYRHNRAYQLFKAAKDRDELTAAYLFRYVVRDLSIDGTDPYPLPFDGYVDGRPYGCIPNDEAICRSSTRGVLVAQGVAAGNNPVDAVLWAMAGTQLATIAVPLWVRAGSVPEEVNGNPGSRLCDRAIQLSGWIYNNGAVDTWNLTNPSRAGLWDWLFPMEDWVFAKTAQFLNSPDFSYDRLEAFQNEIAAQVADSLETWKPFYDVTEMLEPVFANENVILAWGELEPEGRNGREIQGYDVYRCDQPFRDGNRGVNLATVSEPRLEDRSPLHGGAFYRVEAVVR